MELLKYNALFKNVYLHRANESYVIKRSTELHCAVFRNRSQAGQAFGGGMKVKTEKMQKRAARFADHLDTKKQRSEPLTLQLNNFIVSLRLYCTIPQIDCGMLHL